MAVLRRMVHPFLQRPLVMRPAPRRTPEPHLPADVVSSLLAAIALVAGDADFQCHAISGLEVDSRDGGANAHDHAGGFMAEGQGLLDGDVADAEVPVVVEVGAADGGGADFDLELGGRGRWKGTRFLGMVIGACWKSGEMKRWTYKAEILRPV